jgi:methylmalonyl-CoA/ethylmalonyl-CoA epimerase
VGIAVRRLEEAYRFYRDTLGLPLLREAVVADQGVRAALLGAGDSEVELLEPVDAAGGVARFLARRGEGLHHLCFEVGAVDAVVDDLRRRGVELIDVVPRAGLAGRIAFLHPRACAGVLVELVTPPDGSAGPASPLHLKRLVIGAREPHRAAERYRMLVGLTEVAMNGGPRVMLAAGQETLLLVPAEEVGGFEGLVALSMVAEDAFAATVAALDRAGAKFLRGAGEITVEPASSHGVHLHISRHRFP